MSRSYRSPFLKLAGSALACVVLTNGALATEATIVTLTQTGCQFLEPEGADHGFRTTSKADCERTNASSGDARVASAEVIRLKPGKYVIRVTNRDVPYELGFWLRGDGLKNRALLPSVSGGGLATGASKDYEIDLVPGEYVYSCPLNPTPDYKLVVEG